MSIFRAISPSGVTLFSLVARLVAETPVEFAESKLRPATNGEMPGVAILVAREGKVLFQGAAGFADLEKKEPLTVETKFRIGSVTKQFTAAAILRLADEGKLSLTDPLAKHLPDFPSGESITLRHLLTHTSGLHNYTDKPAMLLGAATPIAPADLIASIRSDPLDFAPGTNFRYSNSAYFLLGEIVAKVSGQTFGDFLRAAFFEPLALKNTGIFLNATPPPHAARGYAVSDGKAALAQDWDMSWAGGAGAIYSTIGDLLLWNEALYGGRVLKPESLRLMTTPNPLPPGADGLNYGFGLALSEVSRFPSISHSGGLPGWSSDLMWLPKQRLTVVALANAMPAAPELTPIKLTRSIATRFLAEETTKLPALAEDKSVDPNSYTAFVGRYDYQSAILTVTTENRRIFAQLTGQERFEIFPKAEDAFFFKVADAQVVFLRNDTGKVVAVQHTQNGNTFRAPRLEEEKVALTPEQLDAFVGKYQYGPGAVLTVTRDGPQLFAQLTGQPAIPIFATGDSSFEWRIVTAQVRFTKGEDGKVTKATHTQNGVTFDAPKIK